MDWWSLCIHRCVDFSTVKGSMYIKGKWSSPNLSSTGFNPFITAASKCFLMHLPITVNTTYTDHYSFGDLKGKWSPILSFLGLTTFILWFHDAFISGEIARGIFDSVDSKDNYHYDGKMIRSYGKVAWNTTHIGKGQQWQKQLWGQWWRQWCWNWNRR